MSMIDDSLVLIFNVLIGLFWILVFTDLICLFAFPRSLINASRQN